MYFYGLDWIGLDWIGLDRLDLMDWMCGVGSCMIAIVLGFLRDVVEMSGDAGGFWIWKGR